MANAIIWLGSIGALGLWCVWDLFLFVRQKKGERELLLLRDAIFLGILTVCDGFAAAQSEHQIATLEDKLKPRTLIDAEFDKGWASSAGLVRGAADPGIEVNVYAVGDEADLQERENFGKLIKAAIERHGWKAQLNRRSLAINSVQMCGTSGIGLYGPPVTTGVIWWALNAGGVFPNTGGPMSDNPPVSITITICKAPH